MAKSKTKGRKGKGDAQAEKEGDKGRDATREGGNGGTEADAAEGEGENVLQRIAKLELDFNASRANANNLLILIDILKSNPTPETTHATLQSLQRIFVSLFKDGELDRPLKKPPAKKTTADSKQAAPTTTTTTTTTGTKRKRDGDGHDDGQGEDKDPETAIRAWFRKTYAEYLTLLLAALRSDEPAVQLLSFRLLLSLVKLSTIRASTRSHSYSFDADLLYRVVESLALAVEPTPAPSGPTGTKKSTLPTTITTGTTDTAIDIASKSKKRRAKLEAHLGPAVVEAASRWDDVRMYLWKGIARVCDAWTTSGASTGGKVKPTPTPPTAPSTLFYLLSSLSAPSTPVAFLGGDPSSFLPATTTSLPADPPAVLDGDTHKRAFSDAWISFLRVPLDKETLEEALVVVHRRVVPYMVGGARLMDFLTGAYDAGGVLSILALNGVFALMQKHNLDYPNFYPKLYRLLDDRVMRVKYRSRFLRLLDLFLGSTHLPAYLVAAFAKRLSRLLLTAPPAATVAVLPLIHNLLKRHPACLVLIHRSDEQVSQWRAALVAAGASGSGFPDPYDHAEEDPAKCNALMSSLWEVASLRGHYLPVVKGLARAFEDRLGREEFQVEEFLDEDWVSLIEAETTRPIKTDPPAGRWTGSASDLGWDRELVAMMVKGGGVEV